MKDVMIGLLYLPLIWKSKCIVAVAEKRCGMKNEERQELWKKLKK